MAYQPYLNPMPVTGTVAVTGTFWQTTQPVSAASLPLPTGAATETSLASLNAKIITGAASGTSNESNVRPNMSTTLRLWDTTLTAGAQLVTAYGDQTNGLWVNVKTANLGTVTVSGPLTDTQLRASAVPVSASSLPLPSGAATETTLSALNTKVNTAVASALASESVSRMAVGSTIRLWDTTQAAGSQLVTANGDQVSGMWMNVKASVLPTGASTETTLASLNNKFATGAAASAGSESTARLLTTSSIRFLDTTQTAGSQMVAAYGDQTAGMWVNVKTPLTKGTQGSTGLTVQPLRDAGRAIVNAATAIAGVTAVTTEALLTLNVSRDGAATSAVTTIAVTSGKRYRIQGIVASTRSTSAAVISGRVSLRMNPSGAVTASSPIIAIASMTQQAAALTEGGDTCVIMFPDGIEVSGTMQVGLSQVCSATTGVVYASLIGYEY